MSIRLDREGAIYQNILHLVGSSEPKRFEAKVLFGKGYKHEGHQVGNRILRNEKYLCKVGKYDMAYLLGNQWIRIDKSERQSN